MGLKMDLFLLETDFSGDRMANTTSSEMSAAERM